MSMKTRCRRREVRFIIVVIILAITSIVINIVRTPVPVMGNRLDKMPMAINGWQGVDVLIEERVYEILQTRNVLIRDYANIKDQRKINVQIVYSPDNRKVAHPPEVCMIGSGSEIVEKEITNFEISGRRIEANKLVLSHGSSKSIMLYFYLTGNTLTANYYKQQMKIVINKLRGKDTGTAMVKITAVITIDEGNTIKSLKAFLSDLLPILPQYLI
ncbi:MAG: exosortase C-terminal domain/associated protein EpsI [Candidatus Omnitrophota bacterium]